MQDQKTKGIILRKTNYSENDVIFEILDENGELISFIGKGARKFKSKVGSMIQVGLIINISYTKGKNLNYPKEITIEPKEILTFYSKSIKHLNFYLDIIMLIKYLAKNYQDPELFTLTNQTLSTAQSGEELFGTYINFLKQILNLTGIYSDNLIIHEKEKQYLSDSVDSIELKRQQLHNLQKYIIENTHRKLVLKFDI